MVPHIIWTFTDWRPLCHHILLVCTVFCASEVKKVLAGCRLISPYWHYRVNELILTNTLQGTLTGPYWHYRVHPWDLTGITGYTHWSLLTLQDTPMGSYWHYRVHPLVLTDITGYTHGILLALQGTPTGSYWHYRVYPLTVTDIRELIHLSLLTLFNITVGSHLQHRIDSLLVTDSMSGFFLSHTNPYIYISGYTFRSFLAFILGTILFYWSIQVYLSCHVALKIYCIIIDILLELKVASNTTADYVIFKWTSFSEVMMS